MGLGLRKFLHGANRDSSKSHCGRSDPGTTRTRESARQWVAAAEWRAREMSDERQPPLSPQAGSPQDESMKSEKSSKPSPKASIALNLDKIIFKLLKIEAGGLQTRALNPPRHHFQTTCVARRLQSVPK